jgi:3-hydroxyacyl-[acyl-carrier-protein] dehydratase
MPPPLILDPVSLDLSNIVADLDAIRQINPQRFELEQITAVVLLDTAQQVIAGYKDVRPDEFWVRGHLPDYPLLPGVLICEAAAQLCSFYVVKTAQQFGDFLGFGGLENVRFRGTVKPGDRLVLIGKAIKVHRRRSIFNVQGFVGSTMVFEGDIIGMSMVRQGDSSLAEES